MRGPESVVAVTASTPAVAAAPRGCFIRAASFCLWARPAEAWAAAASRDYSRLWHDLRREAAAGAAALGKPPGDQRSRLAAFRRLGRIEPGASRERRSLLLLDPDGTAVAWAGEGLLHEIDPEKVPRAGLFYQASFGSVTLWAAADAFASNLKAGIKSIQEQVKRGKESHDELFNDSTVNVTPERQFVGLDAYQKVIDSGVDVVLLATPPGFRPRHLAAAVAANRTTTTPVTLPITS